LTTSVVTRRLLFLLAALFFLEVSVASDESVVVVGVSVVADAHAATSLDVDDIPDDDDKDGVGVGVGDDAAVDPPVVAFARHARRFIFVGLAVRASHGRAGMVAPTNPALLFA